MAQPRCIHLTAEQAEELRWVRDHHQKAYMRERAAAILKVASALSMLQVALQGLLKPVQAEAGIPVTTFVAVLVLTASVPEQLLPNVAPLQV